MSSPTYRRTILPPHFHPPNLGFFRPTPEVQESLQLTLKNADILKARVIVFQCPPSFRPTPQNLENLYRFFHHLDRGPFLLAFEPRGHWERETIQKTCEDLKLIHVVDPFYGEPTTPPPYYFRLHGKGKYHYCYTPEEINTLAMKFKNLTGEIFCLFNNTAMFENAQELKKTLEEW